MLATLLDVFEISGRGCVVLLEIHSGHVTIGNEVTVGDNSWPVTGIEMVNYRPEARDKIDQGWTPPIGVLLRGAGEADLSPHIGKTVTSGSEAE